MIDATLTQRTRRRQILLACGLAAGVFGVAALGVLLTDGDSAPPTGKADVRVRSYIAPGEKVAPEDAWRGVSDGRLATIESKVTALEKERRDAERKADTIAPATPAPATPAPPPASQSDLDERLRAYERSVAAQYPPGRPSDPTPAIIAARQVPASPVVQAIPPLAKSPVPTTAPVPAPTAAAITPPARGGILTVRLRSADASPPPATSSGARAAAPDTAASRSTTNYLPAGMFGQATLLSGLDAPTGGQAQSNPHPVLLQLTDLAVLPNRYRHDWQYCHLLGAGYGDLSSERAYIRTETLSCVAADGRVLDVPVKGFIAGEDGKAGMRGRLVSKQGQVLGNALLAGVVGGIGTGIERSASQQSISPLGSTSTVKAGEEFRAGVGAGVGRSLDRLADYYIALAEKMFPVVEIDAGRTVDVILTEGVATDVQPAH